MKKAKFSLEKFIPLLRAPGEGLLTVSTGSGQARNLMAKHFSAKSLDDWPKYLKNLGLGRAGSTLPAPMQILGFPSDAGGGICRGTAHGPLHLRRYLFDKAPEWALADLGDIPCIPQLLHDSMLSSSQKESAAMALWGEQAPPQAPVSPLSLLEHFLHAAWEVHPDLRPLVLGGDHSTSGAIFAALHRAGLTKDLAVLHIDAHTDLMEERFGVKHCFATWASHAVNLMANPENWIQVGIRASRRTKKHWQKNFGLKQYWAAELLNEDPKAFAKKLLQHWEKAGCRRLYISHDIDGTDELHAPSTGTPEGKGLDPQWLRTLIKECRRGIPVIAADLVEVAPVLGAPSAARRTLSTALSYIRVLKD